MRRAGTAAGLVVGGALALVLAGCGGSGSPLSAGGTTTTTAPAATTTTTAASTTTTTASTTTTTASTTTTTVPKTTTTAKRHSGPRGNNPAGLVTPSNVAALTKVKGPAIHVPTDGNPNDWPDVCSFLTGSELHRLDPTQIVSLLGRPKGSKAQLIGGNGGNTKNNTDCHYNVKTTFTGYPGQDSYVDVSLQEADSLAPSVFREDRRTQARLSKKYPQQYAYWSSLPGGTKCYYDGTELQCLHGDVYYFVSGYMVDASSSTASQKTWVEKALFPVAVKIGAALG